MSTAPFLPVTPSLTAATFVARWRAATQSERASYQQHFLDLCALVGHPSPAACDPTGERFAFEKPVTTLAGGKGFVDAWKRDHFILEYTIPQPIFYKCLPLCYKWVDNFSFWVDDYCILVYNFRNSLKDLRKQWDDYDERLLHLKQRLPVGRTWQRLTLLWT